MEWLPAPVLSSLSVLVMNSGRKALTLLKAELSPSIIAKLGLVDGLARRPSIT